MTKMDNTDRNSSSDISSVSIAPLWNASSTCRTLHTSQYLNTLKLINRLCATRWTPPDYWQTDHSNKLVMVIRNYHRLNSASRVLISTCSAPLVQTGERKQTHTVWPWPTTLTYNPRLAKVKVDPHAKNQGQRSNGSNRRAPTDKRMDTHTRTHTALPKVLSPLLRGQ